MANYGLLDMPNTDPWRGVLSDPRSAYRTQYAEPQPQPIVTPDSRAGRTPESYGLMGNQAPRPAPWEISSGLAESLSPMVQGYGAGQMASYARDALGSGDYGTATGAGLMAAMSMLPMKKGAAPVAAAERPTGIRAYHGSPHDSAMGFLPGFKGKPNVAGMAEREVAPVRNALSTDVQPVTGWGPKFQKLMSKEYDMAVAGGDLSTQYDILTAKYNNARTDLPEVRTAIAHEIERLKGELGPEWMAKYAPNAKPLVQQNALQAESQPGIRAYHGSPHDFDRFDVNKIGTGEGAQAYGHGLYFAENEGVARSYRDGLSKWKPEIDGKPIIDMWASGELQNVLSSKLGISRADGIGASNIVAQSVREGRPVADIIKDKITRAHEMYPPEIAKQESAQLETLGSSLSSIMPETHKGRMYEVNIKADPAHFLDWDKPLSQQSETVRNSLSGVAKDIAEKLDRENAYAAAKARAMGMEMRQFPSADPMSMHGSEIAGHPAVREAGIPGIRYLDQGSRGAGEGSRNYVVFDPATIEIMRKYGLMGPMAGGVAAGAATQQPRSLFDQ